MLLVQAHWNCNALRHGQIPCPHIPQMHEVKDDHVFVKTLNGDSVLKNIKG